MTTYSQQLKNAIFWTTIALAGMMVVSCASIQSSSPRQVDATNPTVTYQYRNDNELIQANQQAITYCQKTDSLPHAQNFSNDSDGNHIVVFECVPGSQGTQSHHTDSPLRYNYRTDQELLEVSRDAQVYCSIRGKPEMESNIVTNADGSRTVTFHCRSS
jgi:hypothetical protein